RKLCSRPNFPRFLAALDHSHLSLQLFPNGSPSGAGPTSRSSRLTIRNWLPVCNNGQLPRSRFGNSCMRKRIIGAALLLVRLSAAQDSLHVYYYGGETVEQINISGVTVTLSLKDNGKFNQVALYVDNRSPESVNVIPANITIHQSAPKEKDLALKADAEV